jgi:hypothetical protein
MSIASVRIVSTQSWSMPFATVLKGDSSLAGAQKIPATPILSDLITSL